MTFINLNCTTEDNLSFTGNKSYYMTSVRTGLKQDFYLSVNTIGWFQGKDLINRLVIDH